LVLSNPPASAGGGLVPRYFSADMKSVPNTDGRIGFLDSLRAVAVFMVVCLHTLGYCLRLSQHEYQIVSFIVHTIAVPVFFFVDGWIFAFKSTQRAGIGYLASVRKSAFRLLLPWIIFSLAYTLIRYCFEVTGFLEQRMVIGRPLAEIVLFSYGSVYAPQMYFLFSLFLVRLFLPFFRPLLRLRIPHLLLVFGVFYVAYRILIKFVQPLLDIPGGQEPILHALWGLQFFLAGLVVFQMKLSGSITYCIASGILFAATLVAPRFVTVNLQHVNQYLYLMTAFLLFALFPAGFSPLNRIGKNTMGIYLIHTPVMMKAVSSLSNRYITNPLSSFLSISIIVFVISLWITVIVSRIPYGSLLFGVPYRRSR
jgi:fucose 4-O-acetylase-like acetyltransferase